MFIFLGREIKHINSEIDSKGEKKSELFEDPDCAKRNSLGTTKETGRRRHTCPGRAATACGGEDEGF